MPSAQVQSFLQDIKESHKKKKKKKSKKEHKDDDQKKKSKPVKEKKSKKRKRENYDQPKESETTKEAPAAPSSVMLPRVVATKQLESKKIRQLGFEHRYILAPMVGASELAFRLLCRKYGTQLAYTPMMSAHQFAHDLDYRNAEFQTTAQDRPLVCHFWANQPADLAAAAVAAAPYCDAIDLNLGCPQRTAYVGHFGSYLLDEKDRELLCQMVATAARAVVGLPIFCKIRLLNTLEETIRLVQQLSEAGATLVAVHGRQRASWERQGPGARDGPAKLDQVAAIQTAVPDCRIVTNGNTVCWNDVEQNLEITKAEGIMSAEGLLDNPALFLPRLGKDPRLQNGLHQDSSVAVAPLGPLLCGKEPEVPTNHRQDEEDSSLKLAKKKRKLLKKLKKVEQLQERQEGTLNSKEQEKLNSKNDLVKKLAKVEIQLAKIPAANASKDVPTTLQLSALYDTAENSLNLAREYLDLATRYPVKMRSVIFHVRRMIKDSLVRYQLLEDAIASTSIAELRKILDKVESYQTDPTLFVFDQNKAKKEKEALERKKALEGRRKAFEARMMRKAKREGKSDLTFYLKEGADVPTADTIQHIKLLLANDKSAALATWKKRNHAQHCFAYHLQAGGCPRGRTCAFLHVDLTSGSKDNDFEEQEEVAG